MRRGLLGLESFHELSLFVCLFLSLSACLFVCLGLVCFGLGLVLGLGLAFFVCFDTLFGGRIFCLFVLLLIYFVGG